MDAMGCERSKKPVRMGPDKEASFSRKAYADWLEFLTAQKKRRIRSGVTRLGVNRSRVAMVGIAVRRDEQEGKLHLTG